MADLGWDTSNLTLINIGAKLCTDCCICSFCERVSCGSCSSGQAELSFSGVLACVGGATLSFNTTHCLDSLLGQCIWRGTFFDDELGETVFIEYSLAGGFTTVSVGRAFENNEWFSYSEEGAVCLSGVFNNDLVAGFCGGDQEGFDGLVIVTGPCE